LLYHLAPVKLIIQPDDGLEPILQAIRKARRRIDILIFRLDRDELIKALSEAVAREVPVRALIAHTARGDERRLRKLEQRLLQAGAMVARTADDLPRYHGKMLIADGTLFIFAFNYTKADVKARSFGVVVDDEKTLREAERLFEADFTKQTYEPASKALVVSPENSRPVLTAFIESAKKELLIYDHKVSDGRMIKLLLARARAGVDVRIIGHVARSGTGLACERLKIRQHVRAIIRDGSDAFLGSQSLRTLELDGRREVGIVIDDAKALKQMRDTFEADWATTDTGKKNRKKEKEEEKALPASRTA
jgi:phosphatidylserine/phosphatidylglycerophosphate/cardiolipin synthase-like enzyme